MQRLLTAVLILLIAALPVFAQGYGNYGNSAQGFSDRTTNKVVRLLERGLRQCQALEPVYRYDCYRQNYRDAAQQLEGNPSYAPAQQALRDVEASLQAVLRTNADPAAAPARRRGQSFAAIRQSVVPQSKAAFTAALDQARTRLLRSPDASGNHLARIASALDSDKVFLRS
ncbi:hypothetical protein QO034_20870 [Sedimentitalea sp. JM2-8]|uniref:Uncharacterized protein n=1 Tax=Sedimentitalea xiamensis TaxID=3050037 RepID=A0ABT7FK64_9RHOB|nr:hypothetical protein [Sedimentitalea xiamensis]MDK3075533.1 hypothetical protein [Sedimentitalea xiamensis]